MAVYVDPLRPCITNRLWRWRTSCHLLPGDLSKRSIDELHQFAKRIGLKTSWFQARRIPHYDLLATYAAWQQGNPEILVDNPIAPGCFVDLLDLEWPDGGYIKVANYAEAAGVLAAMKAGVSLESIRRPLRRASGCPAAAAGKEDRDD